jgi:osmotically-inducible protein OsmY
MKNLLCTLGISVLLCVAAAAQQTTPSTSDQNQASPPSTSATQNPSTTTQPTSPSTTQSDQSQGGAPQSAEPGRVTGDVPTQVQQALNRQLPASDQVTASVADDGSLKLTGTVSNARDKEQAEDIARSATNKQIDNKIEVRSSNSPNSTSTPR